MSFSSSEHSHVSLARVADNEVIGRSASSRTRLILDARNTGGTMSIVRSELGLNMTGPGPHNHKGFSELIYVASGALDVLANDEIVTLEKGDAVVVPPLISHAFAAARDSEADVLIVAAPGMDRFEYFRQMSKMISFPPPEAFQEEFDNYFLESAIWQSRSVWDKGGAEDQPKGGSGRR